MKLLGSLALLIYGMKATSDALQKMAGPQLRHILSRMTTNRLTGVLTGAFVTCAVQSSSATTVMTVSFVSAGLLTLAQAISVIMGANIGTTLTAWIMSLGYNVDLTNVVFPAFAVGIILIYNKRYRFVGDFLFGLAFLFASLVLLSTMGKEMDLQHNETLMEFFASFNTDSYLSLLLFLAIGTVITCIVQSSAAVMAITILLCSTGVLPIYLGIALVMGENVGTTATANLAALGAGTQARRAALAHLLFNVFGVMWVLCIYYPFVDMVCNLVGFDPQSGGQATKLPIVLAAFHTCFNLTNTAILIGLIPQMERVVCWLMPDREQPQNEGFRLRYIQANVMKTPEISVLQAQKEVIFYAEQTQQMFATVRQMLEEKDSKGIGRSYQQVAEQEDISDRTEVEIARYLEQVSNNHLSDITKTKVRRMMREISELERIGDACYRLARTLVRSSERGQLFTTAQTDRLQQLMQLTDEALTQMNVAMAGHGQEYDIRDIYFIENKINQTCRRLKDDNIRALDEREYSYGVGTMFGDVIGECEKLTGCIVNVVQARVGK